MILKGNSRGGAKDLAIHLMKPENDHVEVHELRGFAARDLMGALNETYAISRATKCQGFLYSLSINPPANEKVPTSALIDAADKVEKSLGLEGQPRAIVFHEKEGRRHAHVVWSRIRAEDMKAIRMSFDHTKLQDVSRDLFREHGFQMPEGLASRSKRDPRNFDLADWQQAKRHAQDARAIKSAIQDAWSISDSKASLRHALQERGYILARGDRRSFVVIDIFGEIRSLPRMASVKTKEVRARLDEGEGLPSVEEAKLEAAGVMDATLTRIENQTRDQHRKRVDDFSRRKEALVNRQRAERATLVRKHRARWHNESNERQARFRRGLKGVWDTLRGQRRRTRAANENEAADAHIRDQNECDGLVHHQLEVRQQLKLYAHTLRQEFAAERSELRRDFEIYTQRRAEEPHRRQNWPAGPSPEL